jgi:hypothetical protein
MARNAGEAAKVAPNKAKTKTKGVQERQETH